jgi:Mce-associated membrane protein
MSTSGDIKAVIPAPRSSPENPGDPGDPGDPGRRDNPENRLPGQDRTPRAPGWVTPAVVAAVLVLFLGGAGLLVRAAQLNDTPAAGNHALTDTEATTRVIGDVSSALGKVFSYTPTQTAVTKQAARELLAGKAARQYAELFGQVEKRAAEQNLTLTTHVVRAGVTRLTDRGAHLLVFLDQVAERRGKAPVTAAAQLSVTAELHNGRWQIVGITSR